MSGTMADPPSGANPFGELAKFALAATERNMALARNWSDALLTTLKEQSEDARANLTTLTAALEATGHPVRYYENIEGGHAGAADNAQSAFRAALIYEFLHRTLAR